MSLFISEVLSKQKQRPVLVFDRGFARAQHVINLLKQQHIPFVMRVPKHVGIFVDGSPMKLDDMEDGWYPNILYHSQHQIPLQLYIITDAAFKDPMYLISDFISGHQIHHCYKRRMQIEHGFRDIKTGFGFRNLVLKKPTQARIDVLWLCACLAYGLLFISYEKAATHWEKAYNSNNKKIFLLLLLSNAFSQIYGTNTFLSRFSLRVSQEEIRFEKPLTDCFSHTRT